MKRICVFTGTRADYGLLQPLMTAIEKDKDLKLQLIVSGMHLSDEFGLTYQLIEADGFRIDEKIETLLGSDSASGVCNSMGLGMIGYQAALERLSPDVLIVLGDRFETFTIVACALVLNLPVAHIHGGEKTTGAIDDGFRHAITKMSHLHFTCADPYRERVIQLGEHPDRVFNVGALGVENIRSLPLLEEDIFRSKYRISRNRQYFLLTFHPVTQESEKAETQFNELLSALSDERFKDLSIIITKANADTCGRKINKRIDAFTLEHKKRVMAFTSMGQVNYLSAMKYATAVVGNSSSGILEAPSFKIPVVNIGQRQNGRISADNIIHCPTQKTMIVKALTKAISPGYRDNLYSMKSPFDKKDTAKSIKNIIKTTDVSGIVIKDFFDIKTF